MNGTLTISPAEPGAPFRRVHVRFVDGGQLRARVLVAAKLEAGESVHGVNYISATFCRNGTHALAFYLWDGGCIEALCSDLPELIPPPPASPINAHQFGV